ncbi:DUF2813 domain-containing protein [Sphingobacteriales bacterium UPWRP_1]|nr:chromosome segregation protein SMC [Sphingobacteriales bacterium TSM_CSM]PSJ73752.1 DUF2813 domain-containing protein [Sphingobacteriales bacterium UPWRP_1]
MVTNFRVENYKSIEKLSINLGRVNVLIGENGCGKSNVLEAFALASATLQDKLDNEFLTSRGIRVTKPELMRAAFDHKNTAAPVKFSLTSGTADAFEFEIVNDNKPYSKWYGSMSKVPDNHLQSVPLSLIFDIADLDDNLAKERILELRKMRAEIRAFQSFTDFLIYSPENTSLRTFEKEGQIEPLGIYGEGLFKLLKYFASQPDLKELQEVKKHLGLFDWFTDFTLPERLFEGESFIQIKDRFLDPEVAYFDQRSSNEGFLFVLFYTALLISDKTPRFFAIDNIEASLNPKLCTKLVKNIAALSKKHDKQLIITTHSPSVLDGLDLNDPEQKLFLVYRNKPGKTTIKPIEKPNPIEGQQPVKLSEAFLRGYLGGLPKNFSL